MATSPSAPSFDPQPLTPLHVASEPEGIHRRIATQWRRLDPGWKLALWLLVTLRIGLGLVAFLTVRLDPPTWVGGNWLNLIISDRGPWGQMVSAWQRWDALWFQYIAMHGYHAGDGSTHFQPLYPLVVRILSLPLGGQIVLGQLVASSVAFAVAVWMMYRLARLDTGPITARLAILLIAFFPTGFFLLAPYSESLFLALTLTAFWFARKGNHWLAGLAGMAAALTRMFGIFMVIPLVYEYFRQRDEHEEKPDAGLLSAGLPVFGMILQTLYNRLIVGEPLTTFQLAAHWGQSIVPPWSLVSASINHILHTGDPIEVLNLASLVGFSGLAILAARRLPLTYSTYAVPYLGFLYCQQLLVSPLASVCRYVLVLFPCFIALAMWLRRYPWLAAGWLVISGVLQVFLLQYWVRFGFVA